MATVSTPPVDGAALTWSYTYVGDQLVSVCAPTAAPNCTSFDYTDGSLYRSTVLDSDPLGYWRLNEAAGTAGAADLGWGAGSATYRGATLAQPGALAGTADKAASFTGSSSIDLPTHVPARLQDALSFETWLKTITATGQASTQSFDYDNLNRVTGHTLKNGAGTQLSKITYGWDNDDNLTTKTTVGTAGAGTNTYGYDHAKRLISWTAPGGATTAYEWDASGNRTKMGDQIFTYDERNRLTTGGGTDYTYTPRGTLATETKAGTTTALTFDAFVRLIADGDSLYSYDALNRATSRIRGTAKQIYAYSGLANDLAAITDVGSGSVQAKYSRDVFGGLLGLKEGAAAATATMSDLHGDLVATFTATALVTSTAYDPFGTVTARTGVATTLGYQGEYTDPDTGKVNMHARWYQPGTGSFTSRDTATLSPNPSVQANRYTYANASPLTGTDPTGRATLVESGGSTTVEWNSDGQAPTGGGWVHLQR